jgi:TPR repeat protein
MARNTKLTPYDEQIVGAFDDDASSPDFIGYGSTPSMATDDYSHPDDPMPLFLSNAPEQPRPRGFGTGSGTDRNRAVTPSRILKVSSLAAAAAAVALAIFWMDNPLAVFANAKASLPGTSAIQSSPAPSAPAAQSASILDLPLAATGTPTRDEIAAALRIAHQAQPEIRQPVAETPPPRRLDADELATLLTRANGLIAIGDIAPARLLLERAADAQEAGAALLLAQTYDPAVLGTPDARSITPDPAMARAWYQKAAQLGSPAAQQRLAQIQN